MIRAEVAVARVPDEAHLLRERVVGTWRLLRHFLVAEFRFAGAGVLGLERERGVRVQLVLIECTLNS